MAENWGGESALTEKYEDQPKMTHGEAVNLKLEIDNLANQIDALVTIKFDKQQELLARCPHENTNDYEDWNDERWRQCNLCHHQTLIGKVKYEKVRVTYDEDGKEIERENITE